MCNTEQCLFGLILFIMCLDQHPQLKLDICMENYTHGMIMSIDCWTKPQGKYYLRNFSTPQLSQMGYSFSWRFSFSAFSLLELLQD